MTNVDYEVLLGKFQKANKQRKQVLAERAGYNNYEDYRAFLKSKVESLHEGITNPSDTDDLPREMVIAFDTTGSMSGYIGEVKKHVKELIPQLFSQNPNLKISIVAFGDYYDMPSKNNFGNAYQCLDLTNNENDLIRFVENAKNTHGGDGDEFYELVIKKINEETSWSKNSIKSVIFIGDSYPHELGYSFSDRIKNNKIDWKQECQAAANLGIAYDTFSCGIWGKDFYEQISTITNGLHLPFSSSEKTSKVIKMSSLARGGSSTVDSFHAMASEVEGDAEMEETYAMYKTIID